MKKIFAGILVCGLIITGSSVFAGVDKFEIELVDVSPTFSLNYLDIILADTTPDVSGMSPVFEAGTLADFDTSSFYYFYQVENHVPGFINELTEFTLFLDPLTISSAGFFIAEDLDDPSGFDHTILGEFEVSGGSLVDPIATTITSDSIVWSFDPHIFHLDESTVLFITSDFAPAPSLAIAAGIDSAFETDVLVPGAVPEPSVMLLFGLGMVAYVKKRLRK